MFARTGRIQLKPNSVAAFTRTLANDIIPLRRQQPGSQDEMAFVVPGGTEPGTSRSERWAGGGMALLLLTCWGAWVLLIGFQPCALSYLLWR